MFNSQKHLELRERQRESERKYRDKPGIREREKLRSRENRKIAKTQIILSAEQADLLTSIIQRRNAQIQKIKSNGVSCIVYFSLQPFLLFFNFSFFWFKYFLQCPLVQNCPHQKNLPAGQETPMSLPIRYAFGLIKIEFLYFFFIYLRTKKWYLKWRLRLPNVSGKSRLSMWLSTKKMFIFRVWGNHTLSHCPPLQPR